MPAKKRIRVQYTENQLNKLTREDLIDCLTDKEIAFCENYIKDYNIKLAAIRAGYAPQSANLQGTRMRGKQDVNNYIAWLKLKAYQRANIEAVDILNFYAKAAFSDISDYVTVGNNGKTVRLKSLESVDGQLIQEVSQNVSGGVNLKLVDKMAALRRLEYYMDTNPFDWQRKIEERKLELLEEKINIERMKLTPELADDEDDGFIQALINASKGIFDDEEEIESE